MKFDEVISIENNLNVKGNETAVVDGVLLKSLFYNACKGKDFPKITF